MSDHRVWELVAGTRVVGHVRWVGGREAFAEAPWPLARQLEAWFGDRFRGATEQEIRPEAVHSFLTEEIAGRLKLHITALTPAQVPIGALWLTALDHDRLPAAGVRDPFGWASNRWAPEFDLEWLAHETARGSVRWAVGNQAGFKAGGRCPDSSEMWLTLHSAGARHVLAIRHRRAMWGRPVVQHGGWFRRPPLQRIQGVLLGRL